jgi:RHS repeat-associated protein
LLLLAVAALTPLRAAPGTEIAQSPLASDPSLISYYRFEGNAFDSKGSKNGTAYNSPTYTAGKFGQALKVVAADSQYVAIPITAVPSNTADFSYSLWVNFASISSSGIMVNYDGYSPYGPYSYGGLRYPNGFLDFDKRTSGGASQDLQYAWAPKLGIWYHIAYTSSSANGARLYVDGNVVASDATYTNAIGSIVDSMLIGAYGVNGVANTGGYIDAAIDDVGLFNRELTQAEVSMLSGSPETINQPPVTLLVTSNYFVLEYDGASGVPLGIFASLGSNVLAQTMVIGPDGNLYVATTGPSVLRFNGTTGQPMPSPGNGGAVFVSDGGLTLSYGLAFGPDGNLYVGDYGSLAGGSNPPSIRRYNGTTGVFMNVFVSGGGLTSNPTGIIFGPDGNLYVCNDLDGNSVLRYNGTTGLPMPSPGNTGATFVAAGSGGLIRPQGIAFGPDGNLYVSGQQNFAVIRYSGTTGAFIDVFASGFPTGLEGIRFGPDGNLYVVCNGVQRYNGTTGAFIDTFVQLSADLLDAPDLLFIEAPGVATIWETTNIPAANFTITGPATYSGSGTTFAHANAPAGTYTITFTPVAGYLTPPTQSQTLTAGGSIAFSGNYQSLPANQTTADYGGSSTRNAAPFTSEPVNAATGNYYSTSTDLVVPGRGLSFAFTRSYNSADSYSGPLGVGRTHSFNVLLLQNADGSISIKDADGGIIGFAPSGGGYIPSTPGVFDSLKQNTDGSFTLTRTNQTQFNFSTSGQLVSIIDRNNNTQSLSYSGGSLTSITDSAGRLYSLAYDSNGHIIKVTDPIGRNLQYGYDASGRLISFQDAAGATTTYVYDGSNRLVSATDPRGNVYLQNTYDSQDRVVAQKDARNFTTTFAYNTPSTGTTTITDPLGNVTEDVLDALGRLAQQVDASGGTTSYTYDVNNLKLSATDPLSRLQSFTYDSNGNTLTATDPAGKVSSFTYDSKNNLLSSTDRLGRKTTFTYDGNGNLLTTVDPAANTTSFTYDGYGEALSSTNARGFTTNFQYDSGGNLTKVTDALSGAVTSGYDAVGRVTSVQNQLGKTTRRTYDADNRLLSVIDPLSNTTQFQYDANGNQTKIADANGKQTQYAYDATNKLTQVTDATGGITQYQYNGNTDLTAVIDAAGHTTAYGYDALRRLSVVTDPLSRQKHYGYDAVGNITSTIDGNGKTNTFGYDALNRLLSMTLSDGKSVSYSYDAGGNRSTMVDWRGTTAYSYDSLNRITSVQTPDGKAVGYTYDPASNRATLTYPDGRQVQYTYDAINRLTKATDWASKVTSYTYDAAGNLTGFTHPNGAASTYQYDAATRLTSIVNKSGSTTLSSFTYGLDKVGNRLQFTTSLGGVNSFGYDGLYRLTSWTAPSAQPTSWTYDPVGNRTKMVSPAGTTNYSYDVADELLTAGTSNFTYDGNGNQLTKTVGSTTLSYGWDALNRLVSVTGGTITTQYKYAGDGNRVSQQIPAGTYAYVNDPAGRVPVVINENGPDGNIDYLYGLSTISATSTAFQYYHQFDGLGSTANLTDSTGSLKANYSYDPWGKLTVVLDPVSKDKYKFTGEAQDPNDSLEFLRARYYDVALGRFISKDPVSGMLQTPWTRHAYQYALGNPMRFIDPSGLSATEQGQVLGAFTANCGSNAAVCLGPPQAIPFVPLGTAPPPAILQGGPGNFSATSTNGSSSRLM